MYKKYLRISNEHRNGVTINPLWLPNPHPVYHPTASFAAMSTTVRKATTTCLRPIYQHHHHHSSSQKRVHHEWHRERFQQLIHWVALGRWLYFHALPYLKPRLYFHIHVYTTLPFYIIRTVSRQQSHTHFWLNVIKPGDITRKFTFPALNFWFKWMPRVGHSATNTCGRLFPCVVACNSLENSIRLHKGTEAMTQKADE